MLVCVCVHAHVCVGRPNVMIRKIEYSRIIPDFWLSEVMLNRKETMREENDQRKDSKLVLWLHINYICAKKFNCWFLMSVRPQRRVLAGDKLDFVDLSRGHQDTKC